MNKCEQTPYTSKISSWFNPKMDCLLHLGLGNCISGIHVPSYPTQGMDSDYIHALLDGTGHINAVMDWGKYI